MPDGTEKVGIWQDGKKIGWVSEADTENIKMKYAQASLDPRVGAEERDRMTFQVPKEFDVMKKEVSKKVLKILQLYQ